VVGKLSDGKLFIAEAGMEDDKRRDRNLAKAEAARRLARLQRGRYWIGTEKLLTRQLHYNLVFLHARRQSFPNFADIAVAIQRVWPWGEVASVEEVESRLVGQWPSTSALAPYKGILHFKPHKRRKTRSTSTEPRWVKREMIWACGKQVTHVSTQMDSQRERSGGS
jgi:hypothetical protein